MQDVAVHYAYLGNEYTGVLRWTGTFSPRLAVLLPGSGPQEADCVVGPNRFMLQLASMLGDCGLPTLRLGKAVTGQTGRPPETYVDEYVGPTLKMLEAAAARTGSVDWLYLIGHSLGGHVAPLVAQQLRVTGIVLLNANFSSLPSMFETQVAPLPAALSAHAAPLRDSIQRAAIATDPGQLDAPEDRYFWYASRFNPSVWLDPLDCPFLVISCGMDAQVSPMEADAWVRALRASQKSFSTRRYPMLNHLAMPAQEISLANVVVPGSIDPLVATELVAWFDTLVQVR